MTNHEKVKQMSKAELVKFIMLKQWVAPLGCLRCRDAFDDEMKCWRCLSFWLDLDADETARNEEKVNDCDKAPQGLGYKSGCLYADEWPEKEIDNNGKV